MWRAYAARGFGCSFGFETVKAKDWKGYIVKCNYDPDEMTRLIVKSMDKIRSLFVDDLKARAAKPLTTYVNVCFDHLRWFAPIFKHPIFSDEKEWRLIFVKPVDVQKTDDNNRRFIEIPPQGSSQTAAPIGAVCAGPACTPERCLEVYNAIEGGPLKGVKLHYIKGN